MSKKNKKITILGCGWVGNALKEKLELTSYEVNCLYRDTEVGTRVGFYACDVLIIAVPPSDAYLDVIADAYSLLSLNEGQDTQVIFLSSTSFYRGKKIIIEAEELAKIKDPHTVILRLGGLMGYDRIAGKYTAGKTVEDGATNYVHRDDVVSIIETVIEKRVKNTIFNVVAPKQSTKKEIYAQNSKHFGFEETHFRKNISHNKSLTSDTLCDMLGYEFIKDDVREFWI